MSRIFRTPAFPAGSGPDYANAVCVIDEVGDSQSILDGLHRIEAAFGRTRQVRWGQRALDLDLLAVGQTVAPDLATWQSWRDLPLDRQMTEAPEQLLLPHPRLQDRAFVLVPLADVAPDWIHPVTGHSVRQMLDALPASDKAAVVPMA